MCFHWTVRNKVKMVYSLLLSGLLCQKTQNVVSQQNDTSGTGTFNHSGAPAFSVIRVSRSLVSLCRVCLYDCMSFFVSRLYLQSFDFWCVIIPFLYTSRNEFMCTGVPCDNHNGEKRQSN